jgi:hypothetical protein
MLLGTKTPCPSTTQKQNTEKKKAIKEEAQHLASDSKEYSIGISNS